jgi:hypothetical protein
LLVHTVGITGRGIGTDEILCWKDPGAGN